MSILNKEKSCRIFYIYIYINSTLARTSLWTKCQWTQSMNSMFWRFWRPPNRTTILTKKVGRLIKDLKRIVKYSSCWNSCGQDSEACVRSTNLKTQRHKDSLNMQLHLEKSKNLKDALFTSCFINNNELLDRF